MKLRLAGTEKRLNVEHRTSNIDGATLHLFLNKRTAACDELFGRELWSNGSAESNFEGKIRIAQSFY